MQNFLLLKCLKNSERKMKDYFSSVFRNLIGTVLKIFHFNITQITVLVIMMVYYKKVL